MEDISQDIPLIVIVKLHSVKMGNGYNFLGLGSRQGVGYTSRPSWRLVRGTQLRNGSPSY